MTGRTPSFAVPLLPLVPPPVATVRPTSIRHPQHDVSGATIPFRTTVLETFSSTRFPARRRRFAPPSAE